MFSMKGRVIKALSRAQGCQSLSQVTAPCLGTVQSSMWLLTEFAAGVHGASSISSHYVCARCVLDTTHQAACCFHPLQLSRLSIALVLWICCYVSCGHAVMCCPSSARCFHAQHLPLLLCGEGLPSSCWPWWVGCD